MKSTDLVRYLKGLHLSGGDFDGQPFKVLPWERRFLKGMAAVDGDCALSLGRGGGKTAFCAALAAAAVDPLGPMHRRRAEIILCASSFQQSTIAFEDILWFLRDRHGGDLDKRGLWIVRNSTNEARIEHVPTGSRVRCIGADARRAHGLRPLWAILDEPAMWLPSQRDAMLNAIVTGCGKIAGSRVIAIGTRPAGSGHWFARWLAGGAAYSQVHAAEVGADPFALTSIKRANPSWAHLPSLRKRVLAERKDARRDPGALASFKALRLNLGTMETDRPELLTAGVWESIEDDAPRKGPFAMGCDLGGSAAMSAVCAYWPTTGRLEALAMFPRNPPLDQRGARDAVGDAYVRMAERGELLRADSDAVAPAMLLMAARERWGVPAAIAADRWREDLMRQGLQDARFPVIRFEVRGMGYKDGAADLDAFRTACLNGRVRPVESLLMRSAMAEACVATNETGAQKLSKGVEAGRRLRARDDAVCAAILAVGLVERNRGALAA